MRNISGPKRGNALKQTGEAGEDQEEEEEYLTFVCWRTRGVLEAVSAVAAAVSDLMQF